MTELFTEQSDKKLRATFFRSVTIVTSAAAIILAGSEGSLFPSALTPVIALLSWIFVEHFRWIRIPVIIGNVAGLVVFGVVANEFMGGTLERKLLAGAHLIVYLTWIVLVLPKGNRQYWWLIALSVLQLAISGLLSGGVGFGASMLSMLLLLLWTLSVFSLFRVQNQHAQRWQGKDGNTASIEPGSSLKENSAGEKQHVKPRAASETREKSKRFLLSFLGLNFLFGRKPLPTSGGWTDLPRRPVLVRNGLQRDPTETWVGWRFRWMVAGCYLISVVLALIVFAVFPRIWVPGSMLFGDVSRNSGSRNRTGFSDSLELGSIGQIMQSNQRVLSFDIRDLKTQKKMTAEDFADAMRMDEIRFRGNVLAFYSDGRWSRGFTEKGLDRREDIPRFVEFVRVPADFRVTIVQDPPVADFAFSPYPISEASTTNHHRIDYAEISGLLRWADRTQSQNIPRTLNVDCPNLDLHPDSTFAFWETPASLPDNRRKRVAKQHLEFAAGLYLMDGLEGPFYKSPNAQMFMPMNLRIPGSGPPTESPWDQLVPQSRRYSRDKDLTFTLPRLSDIATDLCRKGTGLVEPQERIDRVLRYLSKENGFVYSLSPSRSDRSLDPVEDFLLNTKSGHCEYFASACTLMLQAVDVPARLISGYYGSEINTLTSKYEVRQRHAHAWVEAFVDDRWQTVEPTPSAGRLETLASGKPVTLISNLQTALSDFWNNGIHQMSAERQQKFLAPVISTSKSLYQKIREQGLLYAVRQALTEFVNSPESWISWRGGLVTFLMLLCCAALYRLNVLTGLPGFLRSIRESRWKQQQAARSVIRFYAGFCSLCERHGLIIPPANSALENASLATERFRTQLSSADLQSLPSRIATAFNAVRFGTQTLSDEQTASIGRDLDAFADALKVPQSLKSMKS